MNKALERGECGICGEPCTRGDSHHSDPQTCIDALLGKVAALERYREIVEMSWKGYGYDQEWDCDCAVCAAIRTRTPYEVEPNA